MMGRRFVRWGRDEVIGRAARWVGIIAAVAAAGAGCASNDRALPGTDDAEELLRDGDLGLLGGGALTFTAPGGAGDPPQSPPEPIGRWTFDDCQAARAELFDLTGHNHTAFRSVNTACVAGIEGQAVSLSHREDVVYVPEQPGFTFAQGLTVAGWFNPTSVSGVQTLARKRDRSTSSYALVLNSGRFQLVVNLGNGRTATVSATARANKFTHLVGTYDNRTLRLYVNGVEADARQVSGVIEDGEGPLLMGNDGSLRAFAGRLDHAFVDRRAATPEEALALSCVFRSPTVTVTPATSPPVSAGNGATFDFALTNNNSANCAPGTFSFFNAETVIGIAVDPGFNLFTTASGATDHLVVTATPSIDVDPGTYRLGFQTFQFTPVPVDQISVQTDANVVVVAEGCRVNRGRELTIKATSVVDDPVRTSADGPASDPRTGAWTFKRLMENAAPSAGAAPAMVEAMLQSFTTTQTINSFVQLPRPGMQFLVLDSWPRTASGALDLAHPPLRLNAIVNRFDLNNAAAGDAGEGRFVFGVLGPDGFPLEFTMIFEFKLPAANASERRAWANAWHALGALPFPSEQYNAALQAITDRFTRRNARPGRPNGSALNLFGTNEIALEGSIWQMRQFELSPATGQLVPSTTVLTPDTTFKNTNALAAFINQNEAAILAETHVVPLSFLGAPFLGGGVFNDTNGWIAPGINNNEARHKFSVNTCNGCHSLDETGTLFLQIGPRNVGSESGLSPFLTGGSVPDPVTGETRTFNELRRRAQVMEATVCR